MFNASNNNNENNAGVVKVVEMKTLGRHVLIYGTAKLGSYLEIYGNRAGKILELEVELSGGKITDSYYLHWIRDKLRKIENGEIVVKGSEGRRDWREEERIKKEMWEDINVNEVPKALTFVSPFDYRCPQQTPTTVTTVSAQQVYRPPSPPCKIS